nr:efflux RND transporter periplasmic adaptor subunit [Sphingomonas jatrophae]
MESGFAGKIAALRGDDDAAGAGRRRWLRIAAIVAVLAVLAGAWMVMRGGKDPAPAAAPTKTIPKVSVVVPGMRAVTNVVTATGTLAAKREMPVGVAGEGGMVAEVLVEPGDWVRAGQPLAIIDRQVAAQQTNQSVASIGVAQADAALAQSELERARKLVDRGFISQADIQRRTATRDAANARVALARAQANEMRARMGRLVIRAPAEALVLQRAVEPGQIVSSGSGALFRLARGGEMELRAQVAEQDLAGLGIGRPAAVTPVGSTRSFTGRIWQLSPVIDAATRQGTARIQIAYDPALRPGGFAAARITSGAVQAPVLPESAVLSDTKGNFVYVVGSNGRVTRRDVRTGQVSNDGIAIVGGLMGDEQVVLSAGAFLNPGDQIKPERVALPAARS